MREAAEPEIENSIPRGKPARGFGRAARDRISGDDVARAAQTLIAAYGKEAGALMRGRLAKLRRRGDHETAALWHAVAEDVDKRLATRGTA